MVRIVRDSINHFKYDWKNRRWLFWTEMIGTIAAFFGAFGLALFQGQANFLFVYGIFTVGSVSGIISGNVRESGWMVLTSVIFTTINFIGIFKALI